MWASKSRFKSEAGKKIEKQVRSHASLFRLSANNKIGHGVASGANHHDKTIMHSNIGQKRNILSNEKLVSSAMDSSKRNKRDNVANDASRQDNISSLLAGQSPITDNNTRHMNSSTMNVSLDPSLRKARKKNRRDDGRLATLRTGAVAVEVNRQVNQASRPMKQDPPRKNTNTKRIEAIRPNGNLTPLEKSSKTSQSRQFKAMEGLVHRTKTYDGFDGYNDVLPSRLKRQVSLDSERIEEASPKMMKKQRNKEAKGDDTNERNPMGEISGDAYPSGVKYHTGRSLSYGLMKRQRDNAKTNEDDAIGNDDMEFTTIEDGGTLLETRDCSPKNKKKRGIESNVFGDGKADDIFAKKNLESLPKDHVSLDCSNEAIQPEKLTHRRDEELHVGGGHSPLDAYGESSRLTSQAPISIDCLAKVPTPFVSEHFKQQCNYCSKPIDRPIWSGSFKIYGEECISLAGHLSTKSCEKVWTLSRSLSPVVEVTKLSRSKFKIWETLEPSCDSIGLYFFPNQMRHDEDLDKLVKEVIEDDLVLQTFIGEAEMLIFPSTLLPDRYKTFQRKHYLWGVFRPRQDQCVTLEEPVHDRVCRPQENEVEEQHASNQQDEVQEVHWKSPAKSMQQAAATGGIPWSPNMDFQPEAPEDRQLGDALCHTLHSAGATAVATNPAAVTTEAAAVVTDPAALTTEAAALATSAATSPAEAASLETSAATIPAEATENGTNAATIPGNHGRSDSTVEAPPGRFFCFVAEQNPKLEQLIQEMQREGSLVLAIRGEAIGGGIWPGNIASTDISRA